MKFCPYCGASLAGGAAPFCAECGKALPAAAKPSEPSQRPVSKPSPPGKSAHGRQKPGQPPQPPGKQHPKGRSLPPNIRPARHPESSNRPKPDPRDEGYDGYYNDIKPIDDGRIRERSDPELVKRVILLAAGAFAIVILAVILMYVL